MPRGKASSTQGSALPLVFTLVMIAGVIGVSRISTTPTPTSSTELHATSTSAVVSTASTESASSTVQLALMTSDGVVLASLDGASRHLSTSDFASKLPEAFRPLSQSDFATGHVTPFSLTHASSVAMTSPDRRYDARIGDETSDHASVLLLTLIDANPTRVVLRSGSSPIRDAFLYGWEDSHHILIGGTVDGHHRILSVSIDGGVSSLVDLPDSAIWTEGFAQAAWYITAQPGEGLESEPRGPSDVHRVTSKGDVVVASDASRVALSAVGSLSGRCAVRWSDGTTRVYFEPSSTGVEIGKRQPILFLTDGRLVVRDGFSLLVSNTTYTSFEPFATLPPGTGTVAELSRRLDERVVTP